MKRRLKKGINFLNVPGLICGRAGISTQVYMVVMQNLLLLFIMAYYFQKDGSLRDLDLPI